MPRFDYAAAQKQAADIANVMFSQDQLPITITGALLLVTFGLAVAAIWRGRKRDVPQPVMQPQVSGFTRWLTPMGVTSVAANAAAAVAAPRPARKSGSVKTVKVATPVSKVSARTLRSTGGNPLEIARRTGLSRDAVQMMLAQAEPPQDRRARNRAVAARTEPTRNLVTPRAMGEPSPYAVAAAAAPKSRALGTRFNARLG